MGKGDTPRPVDKAKYDENYERVFGPRPIKTWTDAPRCGEEDRGDSEQTDGVPEGSRGSDHPSTSITMGGEGQVPPCPYCQSTHNTPNGGYCDICGE